MTTAVLLTEPKLQFFDNNGKPLSAGLIYTYAAGTTTPKASYTDNTAITQNSNPVVLDSAGRANIWISGSYKIVVQDSLANTISTTDNITSFTSAANVTAFSDSTFAIQNNSDPTKQLVFDLSGLTTGNTVTMVPPTANFTAVGTAAVQTLTNKTLTSPTITTPIYTAEASVASAATTDLASGSSNVVAVTGTTTITSFGSNATTTNPIYYVRFTGILTLTYNATSLILPGLANLTTGAGDAAVFKYEGSGNWRCIDYTPASANPNSVKNELVLLTTQVASASSTLNFTSQITSSYYKYLVVFKDLLTSTTSTINLKSSVDNGSTYTQNMNTQKQQMQLGGATGPTYTGISNSNPALITTSNSSATYNGWADFVVTAVGGSFNWQSNLSTAATPIDITYVLQHDTTSPVNAFQLLPSAGNFTSGSVYLYGVKNT